VLVFFITPLVIVSEILVPKGEIDFLFHKSDFSFQWDASQGLEYDVEKQQ
jgi:hypothetical protein